MKKVIKKMFRDNFMISLPSLIISVFLIMFLIIGLSTRESSLVDYETSLIEKQKLIEESYLDFDLHNSLATIDDPYVILDPYQISPLTALIMFSSESAEKVKVIVKGKTSEADFEYITEFTKAHYIPVYGLYPGYDNTVEISYVDHDETYTIYIKTKALAQDIALPSKIETSYEYFGDNLMILNSENSGAVGYDYNGDVRWYLSENLFYSVDILNNNRLLLGTNRDLFESNFKTGLYEMDFLGKIYTEYSLENGYTGNFLEFENSKLLVSTSSEGTAYNDKIVELNRDFGFEVRTMDIASILNTEAGINKLWSFNNPYDISGIAYDEITDSIFVSLKSLDIVINVDYKTFDLNYVIGDPESFEEEFVEAYFLNPVGASFEWQYAQGDIEVLPNGDILVFDNGYLRSKLNEQEINIINSYSRGVVYHIDSENMTIEQNWQFGKNLGTDFYSLFGGSVNAYSDNNYMVHSGNINLVNLVPLNDYPVFYEGGTELLQKSKTYEILDTEVEYLLEFDVNYSVASKVDLTKNIEFSFETKNLGKLIKTPVSTGEFEGDELSIFDKLPKRYELNIIEEKDRLVISGDFSPSDEVYVILENANTSNRYKVPTTKDYLLNVYQEDYLEQHIKFYISSTELVSEYDIYVVVNQRIYNTYQKVNFTD